MHSSFDGVHLVASALTSSFRMGILFFRVGISSDPIYSEDKIFFVNRGLKSSPVHQDRCGKTSKTREGSQFSCTQLQHARVMMIFVGCVFEN